MITIYHNPRCSKSRQTLALLEKYAGEINIIEYLENPPDHAEINRILDLLGLRPRELMRQKEKLYKELGLDDPNLTDEVLVQSMIDHPPLIERPIVLANGKATIGRPPENALKILEE